MLCPEAAFKNTALRRCNAVKETIRYDHIPTPALSGSGSRDYSGDTPVLHRMRELWTYLSGSFQDTDAFLRAVRKARTLSAYDQAARAFFAQARLSEE